MRTRPIAALLAGLFLASVPAAADEGPPLEDGWYVERGACPGECCSFGGWQVTADTPLYDRIRGQDQVGLARDGESVTALSGDFYAVPIPIDVVHVPQSLEAYAEGPDGSPAPLQFELGQRFYVLTYIGEGYSWIWVAGRLAQLYTEDLYAPDGGPDGGDGWQTCDPPADDCWWRIVSGLDEQPSEWWIRMRLPDGSEGWTQEYSNFTGQCRM